MILKMYEGLGWRFYQTGTNVKIVKISQEQCGNYWKTKEFEIYEVSGEAKNATMILLENRKKIITTSEVYLLNDEGKTIERIN